MNDSEILDSKQNAGANAEEKASDPAKKSAARNYHVSTRKEDGKWQVKFAGGEKAIKLFDTQVEAIAYAKKLAENRGGSTTTQKREGKVRKQGYGEQTPAVQRQGGAFEKTGNYTIKSSSWRKKREFTQICGKTELIEKAQAYFNRDLCTEKGSVAKAGHCRHQNRQKMDLFGKRLHTKVRRKERAADHNKTAPKMFPFFCALWGRLG